MKRTGQLRVQLHRALSKLGICSRTVAWGEIVAGRVRVNGQVIRDPLTWVNLSSDRIESESSPPGPSANPLTQNPLPPKRGREGKNRIGYKGLQPEQKRIVLALHKPKGYVTTRSDERGRKTVYDLLPPDLPWVFPAGRLDADSEGLLIFTNDSALSERLTSPEAHVPKTYRVTVAGRPSETALEKMRTGIELDDGLTRPADVRVIEKLAKSTLLEIILTEGRNRQIRRMCDAIGHPVKRLLRVAIGSWSADDLASGECRRLSDREVGLLHGANEPLER